MRVGDRVQERYLVESLAGTGGMGNVYRARDLRTGAVVALKALSGGGGDQAAQRFSTEAVALRALDHDAVVRYMDHGVSADGAPFLVMEWLDGESLADRIHDRGVSLGDALVLATRVAGALAYIHARGIVHRDLKPSNVMLPAGDVRRATLVDFGIARVEGARALTMSGMRLGTPQYMAPEQIRHARGVDGRADVFALGCILFECLVGCRAYPGDDLVGVLGRIVLEDAPRVRSLRPEVPSALDAFVARLLERDVSRRPFADARLVAELQALADDLAGTALDPIPSARFHEYVAITAAAASDRSPTPVIVSPAPAVRAPSTPGSSLPRLGGPFVGRTADAAHVHALLVGGNASVALWGAAGVGKTRLALEIARRCASEPARGWSWVTHCELRGAGDADALLRALALALRVSATPDASSDDIAGAIARILEARGASLVVLDNADRVVGALAPLLASWSAAAPRARFLVTARERPRFGVGVEIGPLPVEATEGPSPAELLFLERARDVAPGLGADPDALEKVARIVRALDGNPLAIELAAARLNVLGLEGLLDRLARPLELLGGTGSRSESAGGRPATSPVGATSELRVESPLTMHEAIAWSWGLLTDAERCALAECSVFRGGFTAEAAEAVVAPLPGAPSVLDRLQSLRDKSLLTSSFVRGGAGVRLGLSAPVREFARTKLDELGLADGALARHAEYFVSTCGRLAREVASTGSLDALGALASESDDLLAVVDYALPRAPRMALAALVALDPVLSTRGPFDRHLAALDDAMARATADNAPRELLMQARQARGRLAGRRGRYAEARADLEAALADARALGDGRAEASVLLDLGVVHQAHDLNAARRCYEDAIALEEIAGDLRTEARALHNLGAVHHDEGRFDEAYACYVEAIALIEPLGDPRLLGLFLANLALLDQERGRFDAAAARYARALEQLERTLDQRLVAITLGNIGMLELERGAPDRALAFYERAHALLAGVGDVRSEALCLSRLGATLACLDRVPEATAALARSERLVARSSTLARDTVRLQRAFLDLARARTALAEGRIDEARTAWTEAVERVREATDQGALAARSDDARAALRVLSPLLQAVERRLGSPEAPGTPDGAG